MKRIVVAVYCLAMLLAVGACAMAYAQSEDEADKDKISEISGAQVGAVDDHVTAQSVRTGGPDEPDTAPEQPSGEKAPTGNSLYRRLVERAGNEECGVCYALHDMDGDGKDELLLMRGTCEADYEWTVYTPNGSGITELGSFTGSHSRVFARSEGGVYCLTGQMMVETLYTVEIEGYGLRIETEFEGEVEEYFFPSEEELTVYDISDITPLA